MKLTDGLRAVAIYDAAKGALVLLAGFGVLSLMHHGAQNAAEQLVAHLHLDPAKGYPRIFIDAAASATDAHLWLLAALALAYVGVRWIEAYGLWLGKRWAEYFTIIVTSSFIPLELYEIFRHTTVMKVVLLLINVAVVWYLALELRRVKNGAEEQTP